jgi:hypothetical protein
MDAVAAMVLGLDMVNWFLSAHLSEVCLDHLIFACLALVTKCGKRVTLNIERRVTLHVNANPATFWLCFKFTSQFTPLTPQNRRQVVVFDTNQDESRLLGTQG